MGERPFGVPRFGQDLLDAQVDQTVVYLPAKGDKNEERVLPIAQNPFFTRGAKMNDSARRRTFVDLTPLRASPAFARLWLSTFLTGLGIQLTIVAVGLQIYSITQDTIAVALVGGIALIPATIAGPLAGMIADAFDRRALLMWLAAILPAWRMSSAECLMRCRRSSAPQCC